MKTSWSQVRKLRIKLIVTRKHSVVCFALSRQPTCIVEVKLSLRCWRYPGSACRSIPSAQPSQRAGSCGGTPYMLVRLPVFSDRKSEVGQNISAVTLMCVVQASLTSRASDEPGHWLQLAETHLGLPDVQSPVVRTPLSIPALYLIQPDHVFLSCKLWDLTCTLHVKEKPLPAVQVSRRTLEQYL